MKNVFLLISFITLSITAQAGKVNLSKDINSLGEDQAVVERARALDPKNKTEVVQKRAVDRNSRFEIAGVYGIVGGGDSYLNSQTLGANLDFHINPRWSLGVRYISYSNTLTSEGKTLYDNAVKQGAGVTVPGGDSPYEAGLFVVNWYPVYGKLNFFNSWITQFDVYLLGGYGKTNTKYYNLSDTYTAGGGVGLWLTNFLALRLEARYQTYQDRPMMYGSGGKDNSARRLDTVIGQASLGILL